MWCTKCGTNLPDQAAFCPNCGTAVQHVEQGTSPLPIVSAAPAPIPPAPVPAPVPPANSRRKVAPYLTILIALLIVIVLLVVFLIKPKVAHIQQRNQAAAVTTVTELIDITVPAPAPAPTQSSHTGFNTAALNQIVSGYGDAAVAATYGDELYESPFSNDSRVNVGFYVPIWMAALTSSNSSAINYANTMMRGMDNEAANKAITALGGFSGVNRWIQKERWVFTNFARGMGDREASNRGAENYTSARDAAGIMKQALAYNLPSYLNGPLSEEGVVAPAGTTIVGHRGQGIQDMWSYYIVMNTSTQTICLAVITHNQGKERAVQLTNQILANLAATV